MFDMKWALASKGGEEFSWLQDRGEDIMMANPDRLYKVTSTRSENDPFIVFFNELYLRFLKK